MPRTNECPCLVPETGALKIVVAVACLQAAAQIAQRMNMVDVTVGFLSPHVDVFPIAREALLGHVPR